MKTQQIIKQLNTNHQNDALRYINNTMKTDVLTKVRTPIFIDKEEIWNKSLTALWQSICVREVVFDCSKIDAIQRFLYVVCKRQVIKSIEQYTKYRTENLEDQARAMIAANTNIENLMVQTETLNTIRALLNKHVNKIEWQVLSHKFFDMMSYKEMAKIMSKSPTCLKTTKHRAINKLKKALHQDVELQVYLRFLLGKTGGLA